MRGASLFTKLRGCGRIFSFPSRAISAIPAKEAYRRVRGGTSGLAVSEPPHIILTETRNFAVYSSDFVAVPARQIGISGNPDQSEVLKALATYLNSSFATYHEFLDSSAWGIKVDIATLRSLRRLPIPDVLSDRKTIKRWASLYDELAGSSADKRQKLLKKLNAMVFDVLELRDSERTIVEDLVNYRLRLLDGRSPASLMSKPKNPEMNAYLRDFQRVLDESVGRPYTHEIVAYPCDNVALLQIRLFSGDGEVKPKVVQGTSELGETLEDSFALLRRKHSQWLYFDRCLKVYDGATMYILKPLQLSQWTRSKALSDADDVIGEFLMAQG